MFEDLGITLRKPFLVLSLAETTQDSQNLGKGRKKWLQNGDNPPSSSLNVIMAGKTWEVCSHLGENQTERENQDRLAPDGHLLLDVIRSMEEELDRD